jgi:APA family basic amino acid/polyamine antiporter
VTTAQPPSRLHRGLGLRGATVVGLAAMLGTGVFAVWTPALALSGRWLLAALVLAAAVAGLNASSTARLAMVHPESGGAYAYGRRRIGRPAGLLAGYVFVIGKSASAAAAALTIGAYLWPGHERLVAWLAIAVLLLVDLLGVVRSMRVAAAFAAVVLLVVAITVVAGAASVPPTSAEVGSGEGAVGLLAAAGVLFVAFAGYARITVLGEEVRDPVRVIPRAIVASFAIVLVVYGAIGVLVTVLAGHGVDFGPAPLHDIAELADRAGLPALVTVAAVLGAGGVLLSLIAGVGRTLFAMADAGDAPRGLARTSARRVPQRAGIVAAVLAALVASAGRLSWSLALSAASILCYYGVAHLAAMTLPRRRTTDLVWPVVGLTGCVVIVVGLAVAAVVGDFSG